MSIMQNVICHSGCDHSAAGIFYDSTANTLTIYNIFINSFSYVTKNTNITIEIGGFINPMTPGVYPFTISSYEMVTGVIPAYKMDQSAVLSLTVVPLAISSIT
jgi:hypothetical protein